jgi:hypothetical protein
VSNERAVEEVLISKGRPRPNMTLVPQSGTSHNAYSYGAHRTQHSR